MELILFSSISLFALLLHAQVDSQQVQLNMYQNSFDDQYVGCVEEMDALLPELLQKERNQNTEYRKQKEVLIPMDEMFYIYNYTKEGNIFVLKSINNRCSYYNCAYLGGSKRETCTYNSAPVLLSFSTTLTTLLLSGFFFI
ncbi:uncharacterized protein O3C94_003126 [Discoglossus pictus]